MFSHGTRVSCLHAIVKAGFLFLSDPRFGGGVKTKNKRLRVGAYSHQMDKDDRNDPGLHTKYATGEETFEEQRRWSAEVIFASPQNKVAKIPDKGGNDQWCHETKDPNGLPENPIDSTVLLEVRLYAWAPAALHLSQMSGLQRHEFKQGDAVEHDFVVDYRVRVDEAIALRKNQAKRNTQLGPIHKDDLDKPSLLDYLPDEDDSLQYLTEKGRFFKMAHPLLRPTAARVESIDQINKGGGGFAGLSKADPTPADAAKEPAKKHEGPRWGRSRDKPATAGPASGAAPADASPPEVVAEPPAQARDMEVDEGAAGPAGGDPKPKEEAVPPSSAPPPAAPCPAGSEPQQADPDRLLVDENIRWHPPEPPERVRAIYDAIDRVRERQFGVYSGALVNVMRKELECIISKDLTDTQIADLLAQVNSLINMFDRKNPGNSVVDFGKRSTFLIKFEKGVVAEIQEIDPNFEPTGSVSLDMPARPAPPSLPGAAPAASDTVEGKPAAPAAAPAAAGPAAGAQESTDALSKDEMPGFSAEESAEREPPAQPEGKPMEVDSTAVGGPAADEQEEPKKEEEVKPAAAKPESTEKGMEVEQPEEEKNKDHPYFEDPPAIAPHDERDPAERPCTLDGFFN